MSAKVLHLPPRDRLTESELAEIERLARENAGEPYRGPLLALVGEARWLRGIVLDGAPRAGDVSGAGARYKTSRGTG